MKKIYLLALLILGISCNNSSDVLEENFERGGLVVWEKVPETFRLDFLQIETIVFSHNVEDPNNNIISYDLQMTYGDVVVDKFVTITSFPATLNISGKAILEALNLTVDEFDIEKTLDFVAIITTPNGVFSAELTDFDSDTNTNNGGEAGPELFDNPAFNQAIRFSLTFFIPPPQKIRGTSFEEPFADDDPGADYIRPDGQDPNFTGELFNIDGLRHVMHTARGTGVDDEIGFRAEFIETTQSGFINEEIGVTKKTEDVGTYIDGEQGYQIEDVDGIFRLTFDRVEVPDDIVSSGIRVQTFARIRGDGNGYGGTDLINIFATIEKRDNTSEILELLSINGDELDDFTGKWNLIDSGFLEGIAAYTLVIETQVNSSREEVYYDEVLIYQPDSMQ